MRTVSQADLLRPTAAARPLRRAADGVTDPVRSRPRGGAAPAGTRCGSARTW
ncbi:hypothetical protein NKH77_15045 [Streptomyces sp. M19]